MSEREKSGRRRLYLRLFGWWYVCLGLTFASLAWRNFLYGAPRWGIVLRCIIAVGFALLGAMTLRSR